MSQSYPLDKSKGVLAWGPIPGKLFYASDFWELFPIKYNHYYSAHPFPACLKLFNENRMVFLAENTTFEKYGEKLFIDLMLSPKNREYYQQEWEKALKNIKLFHLRIEKKDLSQLSREELVKWCDEYLNLIDNFWLPTFVAEFGNYGSPALLRRELQQIVPNGEIAHVMEVLTSPEKLSFYQEEEIDLLQTNNIQSHQQKYQWLKNNYFETMILPLEFFSSRKKELDPQLIQKHEERLQSVRENKMNVAKKYQIPERIMEIARVIVIGIEWQDERKKYIFQTQHYKEILLDSIIKKFEIQDDLHQLSFVEIYHLLNGKNMHAVLEARKKPFGFLSTNTLNVLNSEETVRLWNYYLVEKPADNNKLLHGIVASKGNGGPVKGIARIILDPNRPGIFNAGEILVAPMTSPEYVFLMKKAGGIVTDTGGLTSHAAIVSRELEKPCLVGTKNATNMIKDGDLVEVDAGKGIVKIILHQ